MNLQTKAQVWAAFEHWKWWIFCACITSGHQCGGRECAGGPFKTEEEARAAAERLS